MITPDFEGDFGTPMGLPTDLGGIGGTSDLGWITGLIDTGIGIADIVLDQEAQKEARDFNEYWQKVNLFYNMDLQNKIFAREDNAIQRRVLDLQMAGLSPVLAAGSGANAGAAVKTSAPQINPIQYGLEKLKPIQAMMGLIQQKEQIANTVAQNDLIKLQQQNSQADTLQKLSNTSDKQYELNYKIKHGTSNTDNQWLRMLKGVFGGEDALYKEVGNDISKYKDLPKPSLKEIFMKALKYIN